MKKVMVTQSNYIPWKGYFDAINQVDELILYDDVQFTRRDWRNRNRIKTREGSQWLTIPVEVKGKYSQKINETKVSDPKWARVHWKTICHNYSRSAYFRLFRQRFEEAYLGCNTQYLSEVNYRFLTLLSDILGIKTKLRWSGELQLVKGRAERLVHLCKQVGATDYYTGPTAKNYIDESLFSREDIHVHYFDYSGYKPYRQLFGEFVHEVSVIDLLFNEGREAKTFMKSFGGVANEN